MSDKDNSCPVQHKTSIGGQAVMEGVMMRGPKKIATAVRKSDGEIIIDEQQLGKVRTGRFVKLPIIRGCVNFVDSMIIGVKSLMFSAQFFECHHIYIGCAVALFKRCDVHIASGFADGIFEKSTHLAGFADTAGGCGQDTDICVLPAVGFSHEGYKKSLYVSRRRTQVDILL